MKKMSLYQHQWLRALISFIFGLCGTVAFSPFDIWMAALFSFFGLQLLIIDRSSKQAFLIAFCWGFGLFISGISWVYVSISDFIGMPFVINIFLVILLSAYLSLYPALFAYLLNRFFSCLNSARFVFASPAIWQITEYLRGWLLTGFPWLQFGYSQIDGPLKGVAPIFGVEMITMLLVVISGSLVLAVVKNYCIPLIIATILLCLAIVFENYPWITPVMEKKVRIVLVQGNIPQSLKWELGYLKNIMNTYLDLSKSHFNNKNIIIWPESAIPSIELNNNVQLTSLDKLFRLQNTYLITGIVDAKSNTKGMIDFFNSIIVLGDRKPYQYPTKNRYQKHHLVPFGEFLPFEKILRPILSSLNIPMSDFSRGDYQQKQLTVSNIHFTSAICYEIILGNQIRDNFRSDTDFLLTISNDTWFGHSIGPWQHFQMARMRALELGRQLLHVTNNGITAVIKSNGDIQAELLQFTRSALNAEVIPMSGLTPYARWGNYPMWTCIILFLILAYFLKKKRAMFNKLND